MTVKAYLCLMNSVSPAGLKITKGCTRFSNPLSGARMVRITATLELQTTRLTLPLRMFCENPIQECGRAYAVPKFFNINVWRVAFNHPDSAK